MQQLEAHRTIPDVAPAPNRTIGWEVIEWCHDNLLQPDGDTAGESWSFTGEQIRILLRWYEIDSAGRFVRRQGTIRRLKGWGKDPLVAVMAAAEMLGPVRFSHWNPVTGEPVAKAVAIPFIQVAAVNVAQTWNTFALFPNLFSDACKAKYGVDVHKELVYSARGGKIAAVTSNPRAVQGNRATFFIANETAEWTKTNDGHRMIENARANAAKGAGGQNRILEICNAFVPGEDSVAQFTYEAWEKMKAAGVDQKEYYDSVEAPADTDVSDYDSLVAGLKIARGDAVWLDLDRYVEMIQHPGNRLSASRRLFLNQIVAGEDALIDPRWYDQGFRVDSIKPGETVTVGFDGSKTDDATVIVIMRVSDRFVQTVKVWQKQKTDPDDWEVPRDDVDGTMAWVYATYNVVGGRADTELWESYIDKWASENRRDFKVKASTKHALAFDMRGNRREVTQANERLRSGFMDGEVLHGDDPVLRQHTLNAKIRFNNDGVSFGKASRESPDKVDAYAAMLLADMARHQLVMSGKRVGHRTATVFR